MLLISVMKEQLHHSFIHFIALGKADCSSLPSFQASPNRQVVPLDALRPRFPHPMPVRGNQLSIRVPPVGVKTRDLTPREFSQELRTHGVGAPPPDIADDLFGLGREGVPEPTLIALLPHKRPHLINFHIRHAWRRVRLWRPEGCGAKHFENRVDGDSQDSGDVTDA